MKTLKSRRGRRSAVEEQGLLEDLQRDPLPRLGRKPEQMLAYLEELSARVGGGRLDRSTAEVLTKIARAQLSTYAIDRDEDQLRQMEAKLEELRKLRAELNNRAEQIRQGGQQ